MPAMTPEEQKSFQEQFAVCAEKKTSGPIVVSPTLSYSLIWRRGKVLCFQIEVPLTIEEVAEFEDLTG